MPHKRRVASELKRVVGAKGAILIGHAHNSEADNFSSGAAIPIAEYAEIIGGASDFDVALYDDQELTRAALENKYPQARAPEDLRTCAAIAIVAETSAPPAKNEWQSFTLPLPNRRLRLNPLLENENQELLCAPQYPSERYRNEYAELSNYLNVENDTITTAHRNKAFYGDWKSENDSDELTNLVRRRVFLDLPEKW